MARSDNTYSRVVALLKVLLPLAALAILSTVFLVSRTLDPSAAIPYADVDVKTLAREERITAPNYATVTEDGTAISMAAMSARPDALRPRNLTAEGLSAEVELPVGTRVTIQAAQAAIDSDAQRAELSGGVVLETSTGYRAEAARLVSRLDSMLVTSDGPVSASGPLGQIEAGGMQITYTTPEQGTYLLVFNDRVRLVYRPQSREGSP